MNDTHDIAMLYLGNLQADQEPPDLDAARRWYQRAAEAGNSAAMYTLGVLFAQKMKPRDRKAARYWLDRAADAGCDIRPLCGRWYTKPGLWMYRVGRALVRWGEEPRSCAD